MPLVLAASVSFPARAPSPTLPSAPQDYNDEIRQAQLQELTYLNGGSENADAPVARGKTALRARGAPAPAVTRWARHRPRAPWPRSPRARSAGGRAAQCLSSVLPPGLSNLMPTTPPVFIYNLNPLLKLS